MSEQDLRQPDLREDPHTETLSTGVPEYPFPPPVGTNSEVHAELVALRKERDELKLIVLQIGTTPGSYTVLQNVKYDTCLSEGRDELEKKLNTILYDVNYEGGIQYWLKKHADAGTAYLHDLAALRQTVAAKDEALDSLELLEEYAVLDGGADDGRRQWAKHASTWLYPGDAVYKGDKTKIDRAYVAARAKE